MVTIEKSKCDKYVLRSKDQHWWAVFMVSEDGFVSIQSDYGDYNYCWSSIGEQTIQEFLIDCNNDYLMGKFGMGLPEEINAEKTAKNIKHDIIESRRMGDISEDLARHYFDLCENIYSINSFKEFEDYMFDSFIIDFYNDDYSSIPVAYDKPCQLKSFFELVWPEFIEILKEEIKK